MPPPAGPGVHSASRLSHLSTTTLSSVLELTRLHSLNVPAPSTLTTTVKRNLADLARGINTLENEGTEGAEVMTGLKGQFHRLIGLVEPLGIVVEEHLREDKGKGKTGRLVETDDERDEDDSLGGGEDGLPLQPVGQRPPHIAITMHDAEASRDLKTMEEDEEEMQRANADVLQMQRRMMEDQDDQLDSLSSAISRQHALSLRVAEELELHSSLLDDTDDALDRTESNLRRASGRLDQFTRRARDTGSTGLIIGLIILLVILVVIFKL